MSMQILAIIFEVWEHMADVKFEMFTILDKLGVREGNVLSGSWWCLLAVSSNMVCLPYRLGSFMASWATVSVPRRNVKFSPNNTTILSLQNKKFCRNNVWCIFISFIARCLLYLHLAGTQFESQWRHFVAEYSRSSLHTSIPSLLIYRSLGVLTFEPEIMKASIINLKIQVNRLKLSVR